MTQLPPRTMIAITQDEKAELITLARAAGYPVYKSGSKSRLSAFVMTCARMAGPKLAASAARKVTK